MVPLFSTMPVSSATALYSAAVKSLVTTRTPCCNRNPIRNSAGALSSAGVLGWHVPALLGASSPLLCKHLHVSHVWFSYSRLQVGHAL